MSKRILCIDDEREVLELLEKILRARGHDVVTAKDGVEGLTEALQGGYDLIISDLMMPHLDGYDLCDELRKHDATKRTPIILATARQGTLTARTANNYRAAYLAKPFATKDLLSLVDRLTR